MSDIVLSASVRQNLLSLQSTAELLATTQNRLATGKKVNSALDNPTNYFTAAALDSRASDINNLLDGIGNGVQVLQAANTGITSLQKLVDSAKSVANQALQTNVGYTKSTAVSAAIPGATASNLLATSGGSSSTVAGTSLTNNVTVSYTAVAGTPGSVQNNNHLGAYVAGTTTGSAVTDDASAAIATDGSTALSGAGGLNTPLTALDTIDVNGITISFNSGGGTSGSATAGTLSIDVTTDTVQDVLDAIDAISGGTSSIDASGAITVNGSTTADLDISGTGLGALGLTANTYARTNAATTPAAITGATKLAGAASPTSDALATGFTPADTIVVNGTTISFNSGSGTTGSATAGTLSIDVTVGTVQDVLNAINTISGGTSTVNPTTGAITLSTGTTADLDTSGTGLAKLGLTAETVTRASTPITGAQITGATTLTGATGTDSLTSNFTTADTIVVNGQTISFNSGAGNTGTALAGNLSIDITTSTVQDVLDAIDAYSGGIGSGVVNGRATLVASTATDLVISGSGLAKLGLSAGSTPKSTAATSGLQGLTLDIAATGNSLTATHSTFGTGSGEISTLDELNAELLKNNLQASISTVGKITITTINDAASADIGAISGTAINPGNPFSGVTVTNSVANPDSQATRASLVDQFNNIIAQIRTTAQDASFNGVNLLSGDQLKLVFNETGTSQLNITGTALDPAGLGLGLLAKGIDFIDNAATNIVLNSLNSASSMLRAQASRLGSNLSIVQIRQDFSKNLINVLQTGSTNLTIADTNEEAANSQALSTRQSIAVSALALANQSQQSVLKLLQ
jgi:flagellin-like hook-associated protein FlgL